MNRDKQSRDIPSPAQGFARILYAIRYSISGIVAAFRDEAAFRQICLLFCICAFCAFYFAKTWGEIVILILPACLCVVVELLNTAIENTVDMVTDKWHPLAKKAKDMGSGAQLISQGLLIFVWILYFSMG